MVGLSCFISLWVGVCGGGEERRGGVEWEGRGGRKGELDIFKERKER